MLGKYAYKISPKSKSILNSCVPTSLGAHDPQQKLKIPLTDWGQGGSSPTSPPPASHSSKRHALAKTIPRERRTAHRGWIISHFSPVSWPKVGDYPLSCAVRPEIHSRASGNPLSFLHRRPHSSCGEIVPGYLPQGPLSGTISPQVIWGMSQRAPRRMA